MKPAILAVLTLVPAAAFAQQDSVCMDQFEMEAALIDWYGESPIRRSDDRSAQMWANPETGTWSLVSYLTDGQACVIASGDAMTSPEAEDLRVAGLME